MMGGAGVAGREMGGGWAEVGGSGGGFYSGRLPIYHGIAVLVFRRRCIGRAAQGSMEICYESDF